MIPAVALFLVLTLSIVVVRIGSVALRLTGMSREAARFQARSAFTGAGFTTSESEAIVNHPVRRRIVSQLMTVGSIGLVSVMTTIIVSLVGSSEAEGGILLQLVWLAGVMLVLWCVALNPKADRIMCAAIGRVLERTQDLGAHLPVRLLQMPAEHGVTRILIHRESGLAGGPLRELAPNNVMVLGLQREDGTFLSQPDLAEEMRLADEVFVYGPDDAVSSLHEAVRKRQRARR